MKKIMFNDKFCLTQAVLDGTKTMTRRFITCPKRINGTDVYGFKVSSNGEMTMVDYVDADGYTIRAWEPRYQVGEVVAIAQSYKDAGISPIAVIGHSKGLLSTATIWAKDVAGYTNKMFTRADLMPHHIKITDVRMERLQDISEDDIMCEGIEYANGGYYVNYNKETHSRTWLGNTLHEAYAALINKISGKGTWERNPWVVVYEFEKVD